MGINLEGHQCSKKARRASNLDWIAISPKPSLHTLGLRMSVIRMSVAPGPVRADNAELYARPFASNPPGRHAEPYARPFASNPPGRHPFASNPPGRQAELYARPFASNPPGRQEPLISTCIT